MKILLSKEDNILIDQCLSEKEIEKERAFGALYNKYSDKLKKSMERRFSDKSEAEDIVQLTFIKAWQNLKKFNRNSQFYTWIYRIALNQAYNLFNKKQKNKIEFFDDFGEDSALSCKKASCDFKPHEVESLLYKIANNLPKKQGEIFKYICIDGLSNTEISEKYGYRKETIKSNYFFAKERATEMVDRGYWVYRKDHRSSKEFKMVVV